MTMSPDEIRAAFNALSSEDQKATGLVPAKVNKSWDTVRSAVEAHLKKNDSFSLQDLRDEGIVDKGVKSRALMLCVIEPLRKKGVEIVEQKGVLPRNATLFHVPGKSKEIEADEKTVFDKPSKAAACFVATHLINGQVGTIDVRKIMTKKQFPFMTNRKLSNKFKPMLIDEAEKIGCKQTNRPFVFVKEVE